MLAWCDSAARSPCASSTASAAAGSRRAEVHRPGHRLGSPASTTLGGTMAEPKQGEPKQEQTEDRVGREGGRWLNARPTPAEFAEWFETNMNIDPALNALDYVGGVVLIPAVDTK